MLAGRGAGVVSKGEVVTPTGERSCQGVTATVTAGEDAPEEGRGEELCFQFPLDHARSCARPISMRWRMLPRDFPPHYWHSHVRPIGMRIRILVRDEARTHARSYVQYYTHIPRCSIPLLDTSFFSFFHNLRLRLAYALTPKGHYGDFRRVSLYNRDLTAW